MASVLDIYVTKHCFGTAEAERMAVDVNRRIPGVQVNLQVLDDMERNDLTFVFATPSYYLDGRLIFLGNPKLEELIAKLHSAASNRGDGHD